MRSELGEHAGELDADALRGPIAEYSGGAARSELGHAEVVFTIPAESVRQATSTALAVLGTYPWPLRSLRVLTTADFDRLTDAMDLPPLVSVQEAADGLGMTRQGVLKAIKGKVLPATRVGGTWVLRQSVVDNARARRGA
ncbi:helix-turn-helix domain-containing protein [Rhodococcus sp. NPDC127530]|uniref:helix-turn-helix domain-containing protein n=1 Tax=unclassified Rhodococcus (in: high G+C Gram-positive bacteria) TaxID=192944 RepID=UPI003635BFC7